MSECECPDEDGLGVCWLCMRVASLDELEEWTRRERLRHMPWPFRQFYRKITVTYLRCPGGCMKEVAK